MSEITISKDEYSTLMRMLYLADWMLTSNIVDEDEISNDVKKCVSLYQRAAAYADKMGLSYAFEYDPELNKYVETSEWESEQDKYIENYEACNLHAEELIGNLGKNK